MRTGELVDDGFEEARLCRQGHGSRTYRTHEERSERLCGDPWQGRCAARRDRDVLGEPAQYTVPFLLTWRDGRCTPSRERRQTVGVAVEHRSAPREVYPR